MKTLGFIIFFSALSFCATAQTEISAPQKQLQNERPVKFAAPIKRVLNGQHTTYNDANQITQEGIFSNNFLMDGKKYIYHPNGTLKYIELYKNGQLTGTETK